MTDVSSNDTTIYFTLGDQTAILEKQLIVDYLKLICRKINREYLNIGKLADNVYPKLKYINTLSDINEQIVGSSSEMMTDHQDYACIAMYILVSKLHENTSDDYAQVVDKMNHNVNTKKNKAAPLVSDEFTAYVMQYQDQLNEVLAKNYYRDYNYNLFGYRTLEKAYLKRIYGGKIVERPQHMLMRVAVAIHFRKNDLRRILETYDLISQGYFTHATPTLFNAGSVFEQLSSCFLISIPDDMSGIGECLQACGLISKHAGGIGITDASRIRVQGAYISSTQGDANGLTVMPVFNALSRFANQGGKRPGSIAFYLEPWHGDIMYFLDLKKNTGAETERARDLFLALTINDIFMQRVEENGMWSLMCPDDCPNLLDKYGDEFTNIYLDYEKQGKYLSQIHARDLWFKIMETQIETGVPYILFKDATNKKSNQSNIGTINGSNLCVSGETQILTSSGYHQIGLLEGQIINVWNGHEFSETIVMRTGKSQQLSQISFSNGSKLKCTPYHKFHLMNEIKTAEELTIGDTLIEINYPVIHDGLVDLVDSEDVLPRHSSLDTKIKWLDRTLVDSYIMMDRDMYFLCLECYSADYAANTKYMLQTMGCNPICCETTNSYVVKIILSDIASLVKLGLTIPKILIDENIWESDILPLKNLPICVTKIEENVSVEDTFCFNEPNRHMGVFNGVCAGNCIEIVEVANTNEISVCFTADTEIVTANGIKRIIDCDGERILSYFDNDIDLNEEQHFNKAKLIDNGVKDVYELKTNGNKPIKATGDHLFLVLESKTKTKINNYAWIKLNDIRVGDRIITPRIDIIDKFKIARKNFDVEYLTAGWITGDGWLSKLGWGVCFGPTDTYAAEIVIAKMNEWQQSTIALPGGHDKPVSTFTQPNGVIMWQCSKANFKKLLHDKFGFVQSKGPTKVIDDKIKNSSPLEQASFLSGYFSADGCVLLSKEKNKLSVNLSSASEQMLYDVQSMLIPFGISSRIRFGEVKSRPGRSQGILSIHGEININNFQKYINFDLCPAKKDRLHRYINEYKRKNTMYSDYGKVISIAHLGQQRVYDLSLKKSHNFIANGHVVHNCNLSSIALPMFMENGIFNYQKLYEIARIVTRNLDNIIDVNYYPVPKAQVSNFKHRPIGVGVQGLADVFALMKTPFDSPLARETNKKIFETIYFGCLTESCQLAKENGPYSTFHGSPLSKGKFQFDLWGVKPSGMWDFDSLRLEIMEYGVRNSLTTACMPTASTSQILGYNETMEAFTSNIYTRSTIAGDYYVINKYLMQDLMELGLWDSNMVDLIKYYEGSIQYIPNIPQHIKDIYRTVWEIDQKSIIEMSADRGPFVDQTQSLNIFIDKPNFAKLNSCLFTSWKLGLKTGMYYLRSKPASEANKFGIDIDMIKQIEERNKLEITRDKLEINTWDTETDEPTVVCRLRPKGSDPNEPCFVCSS